MSEAAIRAQRAGREAWGTEWRPTVQSSAPGRIELLGNHIDYNGGPVLAAAIDRRAVVVADTRSESPIEILFADIGDRVSIDPEALGAWRNVSGDQTSSDYAHGVVAALGARQRPLRRGRFVLASDVPIGIGVSSSAAICVALSLALSVDDLPAREVVLIAQEAEHRAGTPCGTMDQSASVAGGVIRFDGARLEYDTLDPQLGDVAFLVIDSGVHRALSESSYPVRVEECRRARAWLGDVLGGPVGHLASIAPAAISGLPEEDAETSVLNRRIRHVVSETSRVEAGSAALAASDWATFGRLMTESGRSSAGDYEISHPVVESIVERLLGLPEVLGARMMGGGEGGSLIAIVQNGSDPSVRERILQSANSDLAGGAPSRQVFAFSFAAGATVGPLVQ
ncbi:MAG: hypothetical protein KF883_05035 [Thermomicrobiales bacterium]|nr:hypothetical protein [Thermomicrobiales bacterium]